MNSGSGAASARCVAALFLVLCTGCVYRRIPPPPPYTYRLKLVTPSPERYSISLVDRQLLLDSNGAANFVYSAGAFGCSVYLFDKIPVRYARNTSKVKVISVQSSGEVVRRLSIADLWKLPQDQNGNRLLRVDDR